MKRIHLFEFEDLSWFPNWLRECMTRLIVVMHKFLGTSEVMAKLVNRAFEKSDSNTIIDLCSGSGGPMPDVFKILKTEYGVKNLKLEMTDLYPNMEFAKRINEGDNSQLSYVTTSVDAAKIDHDKKGVRTLVSSLHHMKPEIAKKILKNTRESRQPICALEISDNSFPAWLCWIALPLNRVCP